MHGPGAIGSGTARPQSLILSLKLVTIVLTSLFFSTRPGLPALLIHRYVHAGTVALEVNLTALIFQDPFLGFSVAVPWYFTTGELSTRPGTVIMAKSMLMPKEVYIY